MNIPLMFSQNSLLFFSFELHALMGDSANSAVAHQHKAHVLKIESTWKQIFFPDGVHANHETEVDNIIIYPDIAKAPASCTGTVQRAMWLNQMAQVGLPAWGDSVTASVQTEDATFKHVRIWVFNSDGGKGLLYVAKVAQVELADKPLEWVLHKPCYEHGIHRIILKQLQRKTKYWSVLAKIVNCWRSQGAKQLLSEAWATLTDEQRAKILVCLKS